MSEEKPRIREVGKWEKVAEKAREVGKGVKEAVEKFSPATMRGIVLLTVTIPTVYLIASAFGTISPYIQTTFAYFAPFLSQMIVMFIVLSIVALTVGVVRRLV